MATTDKIGAVMVVGGGISGMQSALDLADQGFKVYLVEKQPSIGGVMAQLDKTFPTNDCAMCIMAPKLVATGRHHNIQLITNADIAIVDGQAGNFTVTVKQRAFRVDPSKCTGCGSCAQKCPIEAVDEYNEGTKVRKAIFVRYPQAVPLIYSIDPEKCIGCGICAEECKAKAVEYDQKEKILEIKVGSIILSPGFDEFNARLKTEYGYGAYQNVVTSIEFERMLSATGPYFGTVLRPSDGDIPEKVAFIQCVGSRDEHCGNEYCSSVCCMYSIKEAIIAKEHGGNIKPSIFFMDMRAFGKEFDEYYNRAQKEYGIRFVRSRIASVAEDPKTKNLVLKYTENGEPKEEEFNLVVLAVGLRPPADAETLSRIMKFRLNDDGFCQTSVFTPVETSRPGIFVSGAFSAPKDIPMTVAEASGAAAKAATEIASERDTLVTKKEYPKEMSVEGQEPRIGVFVCHCGINIGGVVKVPEVMEYAKTLPNVIIAEQNLYTCSQDTQEKIKEKIKEHKLNRVVVASLHAQDPRAALPEHHQGGRAQRVPVRDGQHQGPVLVDTHARAQGGHQEVQGPRQDGGREVQAPRATREPDHQCEPAGPRDRRRGLRHDGGARAGQAGRQGAPGREGEAARGQPREAALPAVGRRPGRAPEGAWSRRSPRTRTSRCTWAPRSRA